MAISRIKNWVAAEILTAADLNAEVNNILNNALSLVSPWTANMAAGGFRLTGLHAGTVGDPSLQFTSDVNTGIFSPSADRVGVAHGGIQTTLGGILDRDVTTADVANTAVETTVYTFSVPANTLSTNRALRLTLIGDIFNNSASSETFTVRVKFGGTVIATHTQGTLVAAVGRKARLLDVLISANNATNAQVARSRWWLGSTDSADNTGLMTGADGDAGSVVNNLAKDSTLAQTLEVTFQHGTADANISARALAVQVELL